jgi:membrane-associated phospholipid phosphatase
VITAQRQHGTSEQWTFPAWTRPPALWWGWGSLVFFTAFLIDAMVRPRAFFDVRLMQLVQGIEAPGLVNFVRRVNELTSTSGAIAAWALALVVFALARWWVPVLALFTLPAGGIVNEGIGLLLVSRTRPHLPELARTSSNYQEHSFPSGHVTGAVLLYGLLFVIVGRIRHTMLRRLIRSALLVPLVTVGFARVWTGAHWPTDVFGAYALGATLLAVLVVVYRRLDAAVGNVPLIRAATVEHDETRSHAHALTSLVLFEGATVTKIYSPGLLPQAIYWLAFQAPFAYAAKRIALEAAMHRRNLAALLTEYWYGASRVARATGVSVIDGRLALSGARVSGEAPANRSSARAFLRDLRNRFEEAGLPTWQIDPRQPRALDNLLESPGGTYHVVDLESGLVSPMASLRIWARAFRRGLVPFYDEVFFDITRGYIAREAAAMRAKLGPKGFAELVSKLDAAERAAMAWRASEPRLWGRLVRGILTGFGVFTWKARARAYFSRSSDRATAWMKRAVTTWHTEGRISTVELLSLRRQIADPTFQQMMPYLGGHILISVPLRFPLGTIVRPFLVIGALGVATARLLRQDIDRATWRRAWSIHTPLVALLSAVPGVGSFAYLAARPVRANRLLLRTVADAALLKLPWNAYERSGLRRRVARPVMPDWLPNSADHEQVKPTSVFLPPAPQWRDSA